MKDLTIVLACSAGMSTSLLVKKMEAAAEEKGVTCKIHAIPIAAIDETVAKEKIDVLLLGPQVRFKKDELTEQLEPKGIHVEVIDMADYGLMNGEHVLTHILEEMDN